MSKLLQKLGHGQGFLKAGFLGFQGAGKTFTATLLAIATRAHFKLKGPIAFIDTENASEYIAPLVKELTGLELVGVRTRKFQDLLAVADECVADGASVLVADSMTHFWRSLGDSYLAGVNQNKEYWAKKDGKRFTPRTKLEFQDWAQVKGQWAQWTDKYLNLPLHIIICGRAGYEYDFEKGEDGKKELIKTGVKMKTETEFGFEPSLLVQMDVEQEPTADGKFRNVRAATILKDRFAAIDSRVFPFGAMQSHAEELAAVTAAFSPHLRMLTPGAHSTVTTAAEPLEISDEGDVDWQREKRQREIISEEIQGLITSAIPGQSADDKKRKADIMEKIFATRSWTKITGMRSDALRDGFLRLKEELGFGEQQPEVSAPEARQAEPAPAPDDDQIPGAEAPAKAATPPPAPPVPPAPVLPSAPPVPTADEASERKELLAFIGDAAFGNEETLQKWMVGMKWLKEGEGLERLSTANLRTCQKKWDTVAKKAGIAGVAA